MELLSNKSNEAYNNEVPCFKYATLGAGIKNYAVILKLHGGGVNIEIV